jgi:hypothetical protein
MKIKVNIKIKIMMKITFINGKITSLKKSNKRGRKGKLNEGRDRK